MGERERDGRGERWSDPEGEAVIAAAVREWRTGRGLTQAGLAELLGVHAETPGSWERGRWPVPAAMLRRLALDHGADPALVLGLAG